MDLARRGLLVAVAAVSLLLTGARNADATPVPAGGWTLIELTAISAIEPYNPQVIAPGELGFLFGAAFLRFPIIDVTGPFGNPTSIGHDGGISLESGIGSVTLENFVVDLVAGVLFAEVNGSGSSDFALFNLVPCAGLGTCPVGGASSIVTGVGLNLTVDASAALQTFLGAAIPAGTPFGIVKQVTVVVPEPGTALLLFSGLAGLAIAHRKRA